MENKDLWNRIRSQTEKTESVIRSISIKGDGQKDPAAAAQSNLTPPLPAEGKEAAGSSCGAYTGEQLVKAACEQVCSRLSEKNPSCAAGGTYTQQDADLLARFILEAVAELSEGAPLDS